MKRGSFVHPTLSTIALTTALASLGCKSRTFHTGSKGSEAPNVANKPATLGIKGDVTWESIRSRTRGEANRPWSDTYWPLFEKGMAYRWAPKTYNLQNPTQSQDSLWQQIDELEKIVASGDRSKINALSPAEKYDWLVSNGSKLDAETLKALQANHQAFLQDSALKDLLKQRTDLTAKSIALETRYREAEKRLEPLRDEYLKLKEGGATEENNPRMKELLTKIDDVSQQLIQIQMEYVPIDRSLEELRSKIETASKRHIANMSQLTHRASSVYPMTADGWRVWSSYAGGYEGSWTWMGHCHGWAPASLYEATPKHSVLVKRGNKEILFTEGDIRGLLTKLWADQSPDNVMFASERCNSERYDTDKLGRVVDGIVCAGETGDTCEQGANSGVMFIKNNMTGMVAFTETPKGRKLKYARLDDQLQNDHYRVTLFDTLEQANGNVNGKGGVIHLTASCRDTNPMLLHLAMTKLIFEEKTGFVVDVTRTAEVWNQPAFKYSLKYIPAKLKDGKMSKAGELISVDDLVDPMKSYRARGTRFLIQVKANLVYGLENGPLAQWSAKDDANDSKTFAYTLEFDKNQKLIGGEWGLVPDANPKVSESEAQAFLSGEAPDFLWRYKDGAKPTKGQFNYDLVAKIHECSLAAGEKTANFPPFGSLKYTECVIP